MKTSKIEFIIHDIDDNMHTKAWATVIMEVTYDDNATAHLLAKRLMKILGADEYKIL